MNPSVTKESAGSTTQYPLSTDCLKNDDAFLDQIFVIAQDAQHKLLFRIIKKNMWQAMSKCVQFYVTSVC